MDRNANKIPQVRLADGFEQRALEGHEDPIILLTLGGEQSLLSAKDAEALRIALLGIQFNFMDYSLCLRRRTDTLKRYTASAMAAVQPGQAIHYNLGFGHDTTVEASRTKAEETEAEAQVHETVIFCTDGVTVNINHDEDSRNHDEDNSGTEKGGNAIPCNFRQMDPPAAEEDSRKEDSRKEARTEGLATQKADWIKSQDENKQREIERAQTHQQLVDDQQTLLALHWELDELADILDDLAYMMNALRRDPLTDTRRMSDFQTVAQKTVAQKTVAQKTVAQKTVFDGEGKLAYTYTASSGVESRPRTLHSVDKLVKICQDGITTETITRVNTPVATIDVTALCGLCRQAGAFGEPLACGLPKGHAGRHAWETLPEFIGGRVVNDLVDGK